MTETEMLDKIIGLNALDEDSTMNFDIFRDTVEEAPLDTIDQDQMIKMYQGLVLELKGLHSELIDIYLKGIIEARAT